MTPPIKVAGALVMIVAVAGLATLARPDPVPAQPPRSGIVRPPREADLPLFELGSQLYAGNCSQCHGVDGRGIRVPRETTGGIEGRGPSLWGVGARSVDFYLRTGYMPLENPDEQPERSRPEFREREILALVAYASSFGPPGPPIPDPKPEEGNLAEGKELFQEHCAGCHQAVAQGGVVTGARVPPLEDTTAVAAAEAVRVGPHLMPAFPESQISDAELDSIVAYVLRTKNPQDEGGWGIGNLGPFPEGMVTWLIATVALLAFCLVIGKRAQP